MLAVILAGTLATDDLEVVMTGHQAHLGYRQRPDYSKAT
jgi:hypothetical protein